MRNRIKNVGLLSALCVVVTALSVLAGCSPAEKTSLLAAEVDMLPGSTTLEALVACVQGTTIVDGDSVTATINGEQVPSFPLLGNFGTLAGPIDPGDDVTLHFVYKDINITKTLVMPEKPGIPTSADTNSSLPIHITWTLASTAQDHVAVIVSSYDTRSKETYSALLAGDATSHTIPAKTLKAGTSGIVVVVEAMNQTTSLGSSVGAGSAYVVANQEETPSFNTP
jgi:hypothetical protein